MIGFWSLLIGVALLGLLLLVGIKGLLRSRELEEESPPLGDAARDFCPLEFTDRIFSADDHLFISKMKSGNLQRLFCDERKAVAILWARQTASSIRQVMREHVEAARRSRDLEFATEFRLFLQYSQLMVICGALLALIQLMGPQGLRGVAMYAQKLSQQIAEAQRAFKAATDSPQIRDAGSW
jgi:hypothetical protein